MQIHDFSQLRAVLDVDQVRAEFPILGRRLHDDRPLVYFDNAATTQTPQTVIDAIDDYYHRYNANIHRGLHCLADEATAAFEGARDTVQRFLNAADRREIIFTRGTTEAINLVAQTFGRTQLLPGDEVIISRMEHHSNIVPWQQLVTAQGIVLKVIPVTPKGELDMQAYRELLSERTRLVAVTHVSNALGTVNPIEEIARLARAYGAAVLVDGAQATPHQQVDVQALDVDFYAFSAHKVYGPTGIGALYGRLDWLQKLPPWQGGGEMIKTVSLEKGTTFAEPPHKFEAGTPAIAQAVAFKRALEWVDQYGLELINDWEQCLLLQATEGLRQIDGLRIIGESDHKAGVISFVVDGAHAQDIGLLIDQFGVALRTGHHCAQPLLHSFGVDATCRVSFALYNTPSEVDYFLDALRRVIAMVRD